jgi:hypothetical protein
LLPEHRKHLLVDSQEEECTQRVSPRGFSATLLVKVSTEEAAKLWEELVAEHGDKLTAKKVKQAIA